MPLEMQAKLLRAVEQRRVRPVGSDNEVPVDVRLLTATNRDLEVEVAARRFRHDLFYRIDVIEVPVPPLCARMDDILLLARHFAGVFSRQLGRQTPVITPSAAHCLVEYPWPGNVRELENCIQSVVIMSRGPAIERDALPARIRDHRSDSIPIATDRPDDLVSMEEMQRRYLARVLALLGGNKTRAAKVLGMDRRTLYRLVERLGLHGGPPGGGDAAPE
jgi:two-component system response regulator HydG